MTKNRCRVFRSIVAAILVASCTGDTNEESIGTVPAAEAKRVVTLSPHLAEMVHAVGAGKALVGVSSYTDYPEQAARLPRIGDAFLVDQEQLVVLQPDLLLAWESGTPTHVVDRLRAAGFAVHTIRTRSLDDVALALEQVGRLTGHVTEAASAAAKYRAGLSSLESASRESTPVSVFYQVSYQPLYTINGEHWISELIELCGGKNVFADLTDLAPLVSPEAVLDRNPEVILAAGDAGDEVLIDWKRWTHLDASRYDNFFLLPAAEIGRPSTRLVAAGQATCAALEEARKRRREVAGG